MRSHEVIVKKSDQRRHALSLRLERRQGLRPQRATCRASMSAARPARPTRSSTAVIRTTLNFNAFLAAFPIDDPQICRPDLLRRAEERREGPWRNIAGYTAAPMVSEHHQPRSADPRRRAEIRRRRIGLAGVLLSVNEYRRRFAWGGSASREKSAFDEIARPGRKRVSGNRRTTRRAGGRAGDFRPFRR